MKPHKKILLRKVVLKSIERNFGTQFLQMIIEWDPTTCRRAGEHGASKRVEPTRISLGEVFLIIIGSGLFVTVLKSPFARLDRSLDAEGQDRKSTRLNSSHTTRSRMPSSA